MKKLLLTLGTIATVVAPIATVVSCGNTTGPSAKDPFAALKDQYWREIIQYGTSDKAKVTLLGYVHDIKTKADIDKLNSHPDMKDVITQMNIAKEGGLSVSDIAEFIRDEISKPSGQYVIRDNTVDSDGGVIDTKGAAHSIVLPDLNIDKSYGYKTWNPLSDAVEAFALYKLVKIDDQNNPTVATFDVTRMIAGTTSSQKGVQYSIEKPTDGIFLNDHRTGIYYYSKDESENMDASEIRTILESDADIKMEKTSSNEKLEQAWKAALSIVLG